MSDYKQLFTIITVCKNEGKNIAKTIESVLLQTHKNYEYYILDGLSTDNTVEIAESYTEKFRSENIKYTVISEKDNGIYNAMNKGIMLSNGELINFMNAGDSFYDKHVLEKISKLFSKDIDIFYGKTFTIRNNGKFKERITYNLNYITKHMVFCHQAAFIKAEILKLNLFDEKLRIASDYKFFLSIYLQKKRFAFVDVDVALYDLAGISSLDSVASFIESGGIREQFGLVSTKDHEYQKELKKIKWRQKIKQISPRWILRFFGKIK